MPAKAVPLWHVYLPVRLVSTLAVDALPDALHSYTAALRASADGTAVGVVAFLAERFAANLVVVIVDIIVIIVIVIVIVVIIIIIITIVAVIRNNS